MWNRRRISSYRKAEIPMSRDLQGEFFKIHSAIKYYNLIIFILDRGSHKFMKFIKLVAAMLLIVFSLSTLTACGSVFDDSEASFDNSDNGAVEDNTTKSKEIDKDDHIAIAQQSAQEESKQEELQPVTVTEEDKAANIDKFIGNWVDMADETRYCIIKKTEIGYSYTDNESNFPAEVVDGVLNIHIEVNDTFATGKVDEANGVLTITYEEQDTTYKKKQE
jgi:hypothetical protein